MLGLKEVANKNIMRKEEEDRKIEAKKNIEKMFVDFLFNYFFYSCIC